MRQEPEALAPDSSQDRGVKRKPLRQEKAEKLDLLVMILQAGFHIQVKENHDPGWRSLSSVTTGC